MSPEFLQGDEKMRYLAIVPFIFSLLIAGIFTAYYGKQFHEWGILTWTFVLVLLFGLGVIAGIMSFLIHYEPYSKRYHIVGGLIYLLVASLAVVVSFTRDPVNYYGIFVVCVASGCGLGNIVLTIRKQRSQK